MLNYYVSKYSVQSKKTRDKNDDIVYDEIIKTLGFILQSTVYSNLMTLLTLKQSTFGTDQDNPPWGNYLIPF